MVDISFRPIRLNRISFLPASVSKYHELPLFTRGMGVGQFFAPMYRIIVASGSFSRRCISWYLSTKLARPRGVLGFVTRRDDLLSVRSEDLQHRFLVVVLC